MFNHSILVASVVGCALLGGPPAAMHARPRLQSGIIEFAGLTKVADAFVPAGRYLVVHDDEQMARGRPCTSFFRLGDAAHAQRVASFHCVPTEKSATDHHRLTIISEADKSYDVLLEYQFAGETEAHGVP